MNLLFTLLSITFYWEIYYRKLIATFGGGKKGDVKTKRAGRILEPQKDGYYRKELFVPDCIKVDFTIYLFALE